MCDFCILFGRGYLYCLRLYNVGLISEYEFCFYLWWFWAMGSVFLIFVKSILELVFLMEVIRGVMKRDSG